MTTVPAPHDATSAAAMQRFANRVELTAVLSARTIPPAFLRAWSAPTRLYAAGSDPVTVAARDIHNALLACRDLKEQVTDNDLLEAFDFATRQLDLAARMVADTSIPDLSIARTAGAPFGTQLELAEAPQLPNPVSQTREEIYGLRVTLRTALGFLADAVRDLGQIPRRQAPAAQALPLLGAAAAAATRVGRIADVVVAHTVLARRASPPELPGVGGDVELYAQGRAAPYRQAAARSRVRFTPGRVEITTHSGTVSLGQQQAIGSLLWVAPGPTPALEQVMDPTEQWAGIPEADGLGTIHIVSREGTSLAALEVADWASQPTTVIDQALVDPTVKDQPLGAARGLWALETLGISRGAATIGVPLQRGVANPPPAENSQGILRPAPQKLGYAGSGATPLAFARRRRRRRQALNLDFGPTARLSRYFRAPLPYLMGIAPLFLPWGKSWNLLQILIVAATLVCLAEPFAVWFWALLRDLGLQARGSARYRANRGLFSPRIDLRGRDLYLTARSGHRTRLPGKADGDLGITRIVRLSWQGQVWGFALADDRWRWRAVLPADEWAPGDGPERLAHFAREIGIALADQDVEPLPRLDQETVAPGVSAASRSFGPRPRALLTLALIAAPATLLMMALGFDKTAPYAVLIALLTLGAAGISAGWARLRLRRAPIA